MKKHIIKKNITSFIFIIMLFVFAGLNFRHTWPKLKNIDLSSVKDISQLQSAVDEAETIIDDNVYQKYAFIEAYGLWHLILDKKEVSGFAHIKDDKGYIHYSDFWNDQNNDISNIVNVVLELKEKVAANGTELIVVMPPVKDSETLVSYETGMPYCDKNWVADEYLRRLEEKGVKIIDFRDTLKKSHLSYSDSFYITDHHWTTTAVFECFVEFTKKMNEWYGEDLDPEKLYTNIDNYNVLEYKDSNLGSHGRGTGIVYAGGLDDFTLMYPKYETDFMYTWSMMGAESVLHGRFEDTLVSTYNIVNDNIYTQDKYASYMNGIANYDFIDNKKNVDAPKVLFLRDSCTSPFAAFAAQLFSETDLIWSLKLNNDLEDYVDINKYDYIVVSLYPDSLKNSMFNFSMNESE